MWNQEAKHGGMVCQLTDHPAMFRLLILHYISKSLEFGGPKICVMSGRNVRQRQL